MRYGKNIVWGLLAIIAVGVVVEPFLPASDMPRTGWFAAIIIAPLLEELIFRGVVQRLLIRIIMPSGAIFIASALFAAVHGTTTQMIVALPCGIILGYSYFRTGTLAVPIAIHALNNALAWFSNGITMREIIHLDALYWIIYALCAGFLTINIIFVVRR